MKRKAHSAIKVKRRLQVGRGGTIYFVVTGLILATAIYSQANLLFWAFGLMVGGLVVSTVTAMLMMRHVTVQRVLPGHGVAGERTVLRYELTNHKRLIPAFGVIITETWGKGKRGWRRTGPLAERTPRLRARPQGWVMHLGVHQKLQAEAYCWPVQRGVLHFERIVLHTSFPFGIVQRVLEFQQPGEMLVYPHLHRMSRRVLHQLAQPDPHGKKRLERSGGNEEFFGLREYRPGDSLKTIDWKRSARTGKLVSRELTQPSPPKLMLLLDLSHPPDDSEAAGRNGRAKPGKIRERGRFSLDDRLADPVDRAISLTASIICDAYLHGYQVGMAVLGVDCTAFPVHHSLPHRTKMLEALAQLNLKARTRQQPVLPAVPAVVVRPIPRLDDPPIGRLPHMVLHADQMEQYVIAAPQADGAADEILQRRTLLRTRRQQIGEEAKLWA